MVLARLTLSEWPRTPGGLLCYAALIVTAFLPLDILGEARPIFSRELWAFFDSGMHGLQAIAVVLPLLIVRGALTWGALLTALLAGTLIDLDHFILADSLSIIAALDISQRPPTHSLAFAAGVGATSLLIVRRPLTAWVITAGIAAHVLRDASTWLTPWLNPFACGTIHPAFYYLGVLLLTVAPPLRGASRDVPFDQPDAFV